MKEEEEFSGVLGRAEGMGVRNGKVGLRFGEEERDVERKRAKRRAGGGRGKPEFFGRRESKFGKGRERREL